MNYVRKYQKGKKVWPSILDPEINKKVGEILNLGRRKGWTLKPDSYIDVNHSAVHNDFLSKEFNISPTGEHSVFDKEQGSKALEITNKWLKEKGIDRLAELKSLPSEEGLTGISLPNFRAVRDYLNGGKICPQKTT